MKSTMPSLAALLLALMSINTVGANMFEDTYRRFMRKSEMFLFNESLPTNGTNITTPNCSAVETVDFSHELQFTVSGDATVATTDELDLLALNVLQIYNANARGLCIGEGFNTILSSTATAYSSSVLIVAVNGTCYGCDPASISLFDSGAARRSLVASGVSTDGDVAKKSYRVKGSYVPEVEKRDLKKRLKKRIRPQDTPILPVSNATCAECVKPTATDFVSVLDGTVQFYVSTNQLSNITGISDVVEVDPVACEANVTDFATETVFFSFTGNPDALLSTPSNVTALEEAFLNTYNGATGLFCDPLFRTISSVQIVDFYTSTVTATGDPAFELQFIIDGLCRGCDAMTDIFDVGASGAVRRHLQALAGTCYCEVGAARRALTSEEFATLFNATVAELALADVATVEAGSERTNVPSTTPSAAPSQLDIATFAELSGFPFVFDLNVFGNTTRDAESFLCTGSIGQPYLQAPVSTRDLESATGLP